MRQRGCVGVLNRRSSQTKTCRSHSHFSQGFLLTDIDYESVNQDGTRTEHFDFTDLPCTGTTCTVCHTVMKRIGNT